MISDVELSQINPGEGINKTHRPNMQVTIHRGRFHELFPGELSDDVPCRNRTVSHKQGAFGSGGLKRISDKEISGRSV